MNDIVVVDNALTTTNTLSDIAGIANEHSKNAVFNKYLSAKSANTLSAQLTDLTTFAKFLSMVNVSVEPEQLQSNPDTWVGVTFGIVDSFVQYLWSQSYSISSIERKLSTIKAYVGLANKAGRIDRETYQQIKALTGFTERQDQTREVTRQTTKKTEANFISNAQYQTIIDSLPKNEAGLRNRVLMGLLWELGLRASEICQIRVSDCDMRNGVLSVYRSKVNKVTKFDIMAMSEFYKVLRDYLELCKPAYYLILQTNKSGRVIQSDKPISRVSILRTVRALGEIIGIDNLSPHDNRHSMVQALIEDNYSDVEIMDALGWASRTQIDNYRQTNKVVKVATFKRR